MIRGSTFAGIADAVTYQTSHNSFGVNGSITLSLSVVSAGVKDPTFLWLPTDNRTVNGLPAGLERYTGEQSFDLVLVNASTAVTSVAIHEPWGGSYTLTVQSGLNNLLVPREQFLNSSFGEAILEGHSPWAASNTSTGWILAQDSSAKSTLTADFGSGAGPMYELGAYWQNRSIGSGSGNFSSVSEKGTPSTSAHQSTLAVTVAAATSTLSNNSGGVPSDPNLYSSGGLSNPPALQSIVTLNVTSQATLDLLLAALLDNITGGVNGTFQTVTSDVASLGLSPSVANALANSPILGSGVYGVPTYQGPPPSNSGGLWGDIVNAVSDVVQTINGVVVSVTGIVWTVTEAAFSYFDQIAVAAAEWGGDLLDRSAATLVNVGAAIGRTLVNILDYAVWLIEQALRVALNPVLLAIGGYVRGVGTALNNSVSDVQSGDPVTLAHSNSVIEALSGPIVDLGLAMGSVAEAALFFLSPFEVGPSTLVALILGIIVVVATSELGSLAGTAALTASGIWAVDSVVNASSSGNKGSSEQVNWRALVESVDAASVTTGTILGVCLGGMKQSAITGPLVALVLDLISLVIVYTVWATHLYVLVIAAGVFGLFAAIVAYYGVKGATPSSPTVLLDYLDLGLAGTAFGAALIDIALDT